MEQNLRGNRRWSDAKLVAAVAKSHSWRGVMRELGLSATSAGSIRPVKRHAVRLGLDLTRLAKPGTRDKAQRQAEPHIKHLRDAGTALAATWFLIRGFNAAFPVEPTVYDLLVSMDDGIKRVQVKTTTFKSKDGWQTAVSRRPCSVGNRTPRTPYDPDVIDLFFIVDGDLIMYLIPSRVIAGRISILLRTYTQYIVGNAAGLMGDSLAAS